LVGKLETKGPLGRLGHRREDNIKKDLQEVRWGVEWMNLAQDRYLWLALVSEKCDAINTKIALSSTGTAWDLYFWKWDEV